MQIKTTDGDKNVASQGVGVGGLTTGIIGTALSVLNGGLGNVLNGGRVNTGHTECDDTRYIAALQSELSKEKAERYADAIGIATFKEAQTMANKNLDKIEALGVAFAQLDKDIAVEKQATRDNFAFLNNKIDTTKNEVLCYCNSTFVPGKLVMPLENICPEAMQRYNSWVAPTAQAGA
jgi:hypothetical protein